jgi:hypothetical protein
MRAWALALPAIVVNSSAPAIPAKIACVFMMGLLSFAYSPANLRKKPEP